MKDIAECPGLFMRLSKNLFRLLLTGWLIGALKHWITAQAVHADFRG
ncbi:MAG TPA: hypothetical protein PKH21_03995 [Candidatus Cloacimonadota bacterium]|nr:hypothetical protein [Candidatus Cloacimonadota bacterium]HOF59481.1 hypothetical protein [Candidatus Cloacimonadota bacterium]HOR58631.1 hypothetical protein [Candidatus Cloacimonadota bacterium]HQL13270.1 hypothetical protein [Candidatus Cloacimonadota bacterium]HQO44628.1 hypothetical protein [Candidatus Cloacimonadota bacterium]